MNNPFDTSNVGLRERPKSSDWNRAQSQIYYTIRELVRASMAPRATFTSPASQPQSGFFGDGLQVVPSSPAALSVQVSAGYGFVYDPTDPQSDIGATDLEDVDDLSSFKPVFLMSPLTFAVPAPGGGNSRIDIIEVRTDRRLEDAIVRRQLDVATKQFLDHSFYKTLAYALDGRSGVVTNAADSTAGISYKRGVESGSPVEPPVTSGYVQIARINVANGATSIADDVLADRRPILGVGGCVPFSFTVRHQSAGPTVTVLQASAPPGIRMGYFASGSPGQGTFGLAGGYITGASLQAATTFGPTQGGGATAPVGYASFNSGDAWVVASSVGAGILATLTPPILVGIGTNVILAPIRCRAFSDAPAVVSPTDVIHTISGLLRY